MQRLVRRDHALIQLLDPPFDKSDLDPGYIRATCPACARTAASTRMRAIWAAMAFAALGDSARAWELTAMINPVNHARTPEEMRDLQGRALRRRGRRLCASRRTPAAAAGPGTPARPAGCTGLIVESLLGLRLEVDRLRFAPCLPAEWTEFQLRYRYRETYYHILVRRTALEGGEDTMRRGSRSMASRKKDSSFVSPTIARNTRSRCVLRPDVKFHI